MFDNLSDRLTETMRGIAGRAKLTEDNVSAALRDVLEDDFEMVRSEVIDQAYDRTDYDEVERLSKRAVSDRLARHLHGALTYDANGDEGSIELRNV